MQSRKGLPGNPATRTLSRRSFLALAGSSTSLVLLAACGGAQAPAAPTISPAWLDPQENPPVITPYNFQYCLHDAMLKHMPGKTFAPALAESYDVAPDYKSATFKLRQGIRFHDGQPVTPDDVIFTFEKYRGANSSVLHDKTDRIETPDDRTVRFFFKAPFLDFLTIYGSAASGAGWVVPKDYYEKVGPSDFKK